MTIYNNVVKAARWAKPEISTIINREITHLFGSLGITKRKAQNTEKKKAANERSSR